MRFVKDEPRSGRPKSAPNDKSLEVYERHVKRVGTTSRTLIESILKKRNKEWSCCKKIYKYSEQLREYTSNIESDAIQHDDDKQDTREENDDSVLGDGEVDISSLYFFILARKFK
ncbi:hypothetical protein FQA39_LY05378 [Lamprigera yunnana]|nr:hypothetical protein FQA39_LY05378 [Lamprigera yunnana]